MSTETAESSLQIDLLAWYEVNKRHLFTGIGVLIVVAAGAIFWKEKSREKLTGASESLLRITAAAAKRTGGADPLPIDQLTTLADTNPGTPAAAQANLLAGRELFVAGKYADARARFEKAVDCGINDLANVASFGVAACLDAENKSAEALGAYQNVISLPGADALVPQAKLAKARLHENAGQFSEALNLYEDLLKTGGASFTDDAVVRRGSLLRSHPELNKPAVMTNSINVAPAPAR